MFKGTSFCILFALGNALRAQVCFPVTRLPVQCQLSRGQQVGSQDLWIWTARVQKGKRYGAGHRTFFIFTAATCTRDCDMDYTVSK